MPRKVAPRIYGLRFVEKLTELPYSMLGLLWMALALLFTLAYGLLHWYFPEHAPGPIEGNALHQIGNLLYFSITTATTTGYGDIVPHGISKLLSGLESIMAFFIFGVAISKLVSNRQEITLEQMHKLTLEDVFHNLREGLFIIRKDFDQAITAAEEKGTLSDYEWRNLCTAFKQGQTLLQEIPDFYDSEMELYTIDERREQLLQEAVHRTLHRINQVLDTLSAKNIDWPKQERCMQELQELVRIVDTILVPWEGGSPYAKKEAFEDIVHMNKAIKMKMEKTIA